jgi:phosphatidate cytidylyltransferase
MNLITFGMSSVSLVTVVIQLAMVSSAVADDIYRSYLGKVACCHFSLVRWPCLRNLLQVFTLSPSYPQLLADCKRQLFLVGQSSFWIKTVKEYGLVWVLFPAFLVVVNDTMAYVFGVLLGKHKLLPRLSPKKTVEGFIGAGISTLAVAAPLLKFMMGKEGVTNAGRHALMLALYISLISPFGGFLASAVKRAHEAKDFGALIPGHGGVVDRFDCQIVTAPFVYLYLRNFLSQ